VAEPITDAELDNLRPLAARLDARAETSRLDKAFGLVCLPALVARLDAAEGERDALRRQVEGLCARVASQSELLTRRAEGGRPLEGRGP
jgi:hypothetical protein